MNLPIPKEYYKITDINYEGKRIRTYLFGNGKVKILSLPPFPHSGVLYLYFLLQYDLSKVQILTFDIPGWIGQSHNIFPDGNYNEDVIIDLIGTILKKYAFNTFRVIGFSFGTTLAAKMVERFGARVEKVAFISPVLSGIKAREAGKRIIMKIMNDLNLLFIADMYLKSRFKVYKKRLQADSIVSKVLDEYEVMINHIDQKVVLTSLIKLFNSDYSSCLDNYDNSDILVANSKEESPFLRKQAEHLRRILDGEKTIFLHGSHEDFILKPDSHVVREVFRFLSS